MKWTEITGAEINKPFRVVGLEGEFVIAECYLGRLDKEIEVIAKVPMGEKSLTPNEFFTIVHAAPSGIIHLPPPLTDEQREQLKAIWTLGGRWLTKDKSGEVVTFSCKPEKNSYLAVWLPPKCAENEMQFKVHSNLDVCSLASWSDPEPYDIARRWGWGNAD